MINEERAEQTTVIAVPNQMGRNSNALEEKEGGKGGGRGRRQTESERAVFYTWLCHSEKVTSTLWASVSSSVRWE